MSSISLYAGATALKRIEQDGIHPNMFSAFIGASGGPKWFVLCGLDKVIFNEFMNNSSQHLDIIGSSAGAFRASCFMQKDPRAAITRLSDRYSTTVYSEKPSAQEITHKGYELLKNMMGEHGVAEALHCENKSLHVVTALCHGLVASETKFKQLTGLAIAAGQNAMSRKALQRSFTRVIFSSGNTPISFTENQAFKTDYVSLSQDNFLKALMASGSIPIVIEGVNNIAGATPGMYRDGGIIDYHFDMQIKTPGLVLYPHFYKTPVPGWFDKSLKSRNCHEQSYDNVLMVVPSDEFVASLPYGKIPDRKDFETMDAADRINYWQTVIGESDRLADAFLELVMHENPAKMIKPIELIR